MMTISANVGEQRERSKRRKKIGIIAALFVFGVVVGFIVGFSEGEGLFDDGASWPPAMAIGIAVAYVVALVGGGIALSRQTDEIERLRQYKASALAGCAYFFTYPLWYVLWKGGFVPEPSHEAMFILFWFVLLSATIGYRFR